MSSDPGEALHTDGVSCVILIDTDRKNIVFFQALFESYEGVGTVRTMDKTHGIISILTTRDQLPTVLNILDSFDSEISWRFATQLDASEKGRYLEEL